VAEQLRSAYDAKTAGSDAQMLTISYRSGSRKWHPRAGFITFRPFRTGLVCLSVLPAGGKALQRAVTKLKVPWSTPSPSVQPSGVPSQTP
jgi:hypothetical protein